MWDYSEKVMDHFFNPKNMGEMKDANAVGRIGSMICGDALKLWLKIDDNGIILDATFQTFGCGSAIASSSVLTEMLKGKNIEEAMKISNEDIAEALGGLPAEKMHCSVMGREALEAAIANYKGEEYEHEHDESRLVCRCFGVHENKIRKNIIENKLKTVLDVSNYTKAGGGCTSCHRDIQDIVDDVWNNELKEEKKEEEEKPEKPKYSTLTNVQKINKVQEVIENIIKPALVIDGGSLELIDVDNNKVMVKMHGACSTCPASQYTIKGFVERTFKEKISDEIEVVEIK